MKKKKYSKKIRKKKKIDTKCQECGQELPVREGINYCPLCDKETYFKRE